MTLILTPGDILACQPSISHKILTIFSLNSTTLVETHILPVK